MGIKPSGYWTKEKCYEESIKYETRTHFQKESSSAYNIALRNKWLVDICSHMVSIQKPKGYWTYINSKEEALKYTTRNKFRINSYSAYNSARKNGWLDEICSHMKPQGNLYNRCIYAYEFSDNFVYVGLTYNLDNRHQRHMAKTNCIVHIHIEQTKLIPILKQLTYYIDKDEASKLEGVYKQQYIEEGWIILNISPTGALGGNNLKWTFEKCQEEALKYRTRGNFRLYSTGAYKSAIRNKWLTDICGHMNSKYKPNGYWTFENCKEEALKYDSRINFMKGASGAYTASFRKKWLDDICSHMKK